MMLASAPLARPLSRLPLLVTTAAATVPTLKMQPAPPSPEKEISRALKWGRMMEAQSRDPGGNVAAWGIKASKEAKFRERIYKGIPDCWRSAAWELMMNRTTKTGKRELDVLAEQYRQAQEKPSTYDVQIDLDVPRTISGHFMFRTRYGQGCVSSTGVFALTKHIIVNDRYSVFCTHSRFDVQIVATVRGWVR